MLVDAKSLLEKAQANGYAVGAFNTYNLEITQAIIRGGEKKAAPLILQVGESALDFGGDDSLTALALAAAESARIPVAVHLDHARDLDTLASCMQRGFTSVMFDGSMFPFDENIERTRKAVELASVRGVSIEAELGAMAGEEDGAPSTTHHFAYTDPEEAARFVQATRVDSLAVAIGNKHGFYEEDADLDFDRLSGICERVTIPLVLHGASGIPDAAIREAIKLGICKINVNTDLRRAFFDTLETVLAAPHPHYNLPRLMGDAVEAVSEVVAAKIALFGSANRLASDW